MLKNRFFSLLMVGSLVGLAACAEEEVEVEEPFNEDGVTTTEVITETDTELVPVVTPVTTVDTGLVETTVERDIDVDVDTVIEP